MSVYHELITILDGQTLHPHCLYFCPSIFSKAALQENKNKNKKTKTKPNNPQQQQNFLRFDQYAYEFMQISEINAWTRKDQFCLASAKISYHIL